MDPSSPEDLNTMMNCSSHPISTHPLPRKFGWLCFVKRVPPKKILFAEIGIRETRKTPTFIESKN
jgi:hypothetical protein